MKRLSLYAAVAAGALALAACGSGDDGEDSAASGEPGGGSETVSVASVDGVGEVLVDQDGMALYSADEEVAAGEVLCVDACEAFWAPLEAGDGTPTAAPEAGEIGVITRPDGTRQVTAGGKPLYTFTEDSPGEVTGDGFSDDFGGQHFTWHVATADGSAPATTGGGSEGGSGGGPDY
jgi:predicted lipoprotein with Yx(FWY)xxD motif